MSAKTFEKVSFIHDGWKFEKVTNTVTGKIMYYKIPLNSPGFSFLSSEFEYKQNEHNAGELEMFDALKGTNLGF